MPSGVLPKTFTDTVIATAQQRFTNIVPTTYEAAKAYLDEEILKPEGQRDLRREMCMIFVMGVDNEDIVLKLDAVKVLVPLNAGEILILWSADLENRYLVSLPAGAMLFYPTIDLPPTSFGTPGNRKSNMLLNKKTGKRAQATIALAYFSRTEDTLEYIGDISTVQLQSSPFQ